VERVLNKLDIAKDRLPILTGMGMQLETRINGLVAEMREPRQSRSDDDEPWRER
jgi:hypothetical protein